MVSRRNAMIIGLSALGAVSCAGRPATPRPAAALMIEARPVNAGVFIDDHRVGSAQSIAASPIRLSVGPHFISVRASGYFPHDERVDLAEGGHAMRIELVPIPP